VPTEFLPTIGAGAHAADGTHQGGGAGGVRIQPHRNHHLCVATPKPRREENRKQPLFFSPHPASRHTLDSLRPARAGAGLALATLINAIMLVLAAAHFYPNKVKHD
jgi:hypothetical protein